MHAKKLLALALCASMLLSALAMSISIVKAEPGVLPTVSVSPTGQNVDTGSDIVLIFNEAMDQASVEAAFSLSGGEGLVAGTPTWNDGSTVMTFKPAALQPASTYLVSVGGADQDGELLSSSPASFTTKAADPPVPPADTTLPVFTSVSSVPSTLYTKGANVKQTFSASYTDDVGIVSAVFDVDGLKQNVDTSSFSRDVQLDVGQHFIVLKVSDAAGNQASQTWSVNVVRDSTPPTIVSTVPSSGATDVDVGTNVEVTFSKAMDQKSTVLTIEGVSGSTTWNGNKLTFVPSSPLDGGRSYNVRVSGSDTEGNSLQQYSWKFSTKDNDVASPTVTDYSPVGENVSVNSSVMVQFSEAMNHDSVTLTVGDAEGNTSWNGNTITFVPSSPLGKGTVYAVSVSGADEAGNPMQFSWNFSTEGGVLTADGEGAISGVVKASNGKGIGGVSVSLNDTVSATTDSDGGFIILNVTAGSYELTVSKDGYDTVKKDVVVPEGKTVALALSIKGSTVRPIISDGSMVLAIVGGMAIGIVTLSMIWKRKGNKPM